MAKLFKIVAYVVDPINEFDESGLEEYLNYCTKYDDVSLRGIKIDSIDIDECDVEEFKGGE